uniref:Uncharacterized protein n=1 Tax=Anguilla anguilla TaxID=7936 RepID=A0A0E9T6W6_ANGAN
MKSEEMTYLSPFTFCSILEELFCLF